MNPANLLLLERTCEHLGDLLDEVVFVGGATVELWITDPAAPEFRLTDDVDVKRIRALPPPYLLATKLEAFDARHKLDFYGSRDWGDVISLVDGRRELMDEMREASESVRTYVADRLRDLSSHRDFDPGVEGALPSSPESRDRVDYVIQPRIQSLIGD